MEGNEDVFEGSSMIGKIISHYKIIEKLGAGGMGVVYKAEDTKLKRTVALKFLPPELTRDPDAKARFIHEAQAASSLEHNNICNIHEIAETESAPGEAGDGQIFIVMACYDGETLKQKIAKGPLSISESIDIASQIAQGLAKAHEHSIVHRDLKPANIIITKDDVVKIVDFGLAKLADRTKITIEGTTLGTVAYMSPEQIRGEEIDYRTDIWSLGVILYEMLTGQTPFQGEFEQAVMYEIINQDPQPPTGLRTGIPIDLDRILIKILAKDRDERYQHIDDLLVDLDGLRKRSEIEKSYTESRLKPEKLISKKRFIISSWIVLVSIILILVGYYIFTPQTETISASKKLVVLPFENLGSAEHAYFADGVSEEITSRLATISDLGVISRKSAVYYAQTDKTLRQIGSELDVDYVLEGAVRWAETPDGSDRVRITPQLIRVSDDTHIWSANYDRVIDDIFDIQSEIAQVVIDQIGVTLLESERKSVGARITQNIEAYHAYLRGQYYAGHPHFSLRDWYKVIDSYQQAVDLDPQFALAYAKLAKAHARLYYLRSDLSHTRLQLAEEAAQRAIDIAPHSPEVHLELSYYYLWAYRDSDRALKELDIAASGLPNNVDLLKAKASILHPQGQWDEYIRSLKRALQISPRDASIVTDLAEAYWLTRKYEKADSMCNQAMALAPDTPWPYLFKAFNIWIWKGANAESRTALLKVNKDHEWYNWAMYWQAVGEKNFQGEIERLNSIQDEWISNKCWAMPKSLLSAFIYDYLGEEKKAHNSYNAARILLEEKVTAQPDDPRYHSSLGLAYAGVGRKNDAIAQGKRAVQLLPLSKDAFYGVTSVHDLSAIYTMVEEYDAAFEQIELLLSIPSWISISWINMDPRYDSLHNNSKYQKLREKFSKNN
jgi:serine/threonine protein kinase/tetratricopeptide (TPR) repeat protein